MALKVKYCTLRLIIMPILLIIMYIININYVQYFTFASIENIKYSYRKRKMFL